MVTRAVLLASALCLVAACASAPPPRDPTPTPAPAALPDAEAAEDAVLAKLARDESPRTKTLFICIRDADPAPERLLRLAEATEARLRGCHRWVDDPKRSVPLDPESREPGVVLNLEKTVRVSDVEYSITAGYFCGRLCGATFRYDVRRNASGWVIASRQTIAIS